MNFEFPQGLLSSSNCQWSHKMGRMSSDPTAILPPIQSFLPTLSAYSLEHRATNSQTIAYHLPFLLFSHFAYLFRIIFLLFQLHQRGERNCCPLAFPKCWLPGGILHQLSPKDFSSFLLGQERCAPPSWRESCQIYMEHWLFLHHLRFRSWCFFASSKLKGVW